MPIIYKMEYLVYYNCCRNIFGRKIASNSMGNENEQTEKKIYWLNFPSSASIMSEIK